MDNVARLSKGIHREKGIGEQERVQRWDADVKHHGHEGMDDSQP